MERRIRQQVYGRPHAGDLRHPPGFQPVAQAEAAAVLAALLSPGKAATATLHAAGSHLAVRQGGLAVLSELALRLATVWDVRMEIASGTVRGPGDVLDLLGRAPLDLYWPAGRPFSLRLDVAGDVVPHERSLRDRLEAQLAGRGFQPPAVDGNAGAGATAGETATGPDAAGEEAGEAAGLPAGPEVLRVELTGRRGTISLSLAGEPLYRRGYRAVLGGGAPLREDIAAAICRTFLAHAREAVARAGRAWHEPDLVLLPFAGTGTLAAELLLATRELAPALLGRGYAFEGWVCHRPRAAAWLRARLAEVARARLTELPPLRALAFDREAEAVAGCAANLERLGALAAAATGLEPGRILVARCEEGDFWGLDLAALVPAGTAHVALPLNPPFGRRMGGSLDVPRFYEGIGRRVEQLLAAATAGGALASGCILCPDEASWRGFLRSLTAAVLRRTVHFTLGGQDLRLCCFCRFPAGGAGNGGAAGAAGGTAADGQGEAPA